MHNSLRSLALILLLAGLETSASADPILDTKRVFKAPPVTDGGIPSIDPSTFGLPEAIWSITQIQGLRLVRVTHGCTENGKPIPECWGIWIDAVTERSPDTKIERTHGQILIAPVGTNLREARYALEVLQANPLGLSLTVIDYPTDFALTPGKPAQKLSPTITFRYRGRSSFNGLYIAKAVLPGGQGILGAYTESSQ